MVGCYGTTEYPEDMTGILLKSDDKEISYEYKCREAHTEGGKEAVAVIPAIDTKVSLTTDSKSADVYVKEGYAFSPMFTLGCSTNVGEKEVLTTWLNLEKAN